MKVIYNIGEVKSWERNPVLAIGVFDGLHLGHQYLMRRMISTAKFLRGTSIVMTFFPHPTHVLNPKIDLPFLIPLKYRLKFIEKMGVDVCIVVRFSKRFAMLSPEYFVRKYLYEAVRPKEVFVGHNFHFGRNRAGDARFLKERGLQYYFKVNIIPAVKKGSLVISSSRIRRLVNTGKVIEAGRLLGRPVSIFGKVVLGDKRGRLLGFPTANIIPDEKIILPRGVYLATVRLRNKLWEAMANIGCRPSFHKKGNTYVEAHIFNFNKNIYGQHIEVQLIKKMRDEKTFGSPEALIRQLKKDKRTAISFFKKSKFSSNL